MYKIEIPKTIHQLMGFFYRLGMWSEAHTFGEQCMKLFYLIFYVAFGLSVTFGAYVTDDKDVRVFSTVTILVAFVMGYWMWIILWRKNEFLLLVHQIGSHSTYDREEFIRINKKLNALMKFVRYFLLVIAVTDFFAVVVFPVTTEKHLIINVAVPFVSKNSEIAYWMAFAILGGGFICTSFCTLLTNLIWYLMLSISFEYKIFGSQLRHMGKSTRTDSTHLKVSLGIQQKRFYEELILAIQSYDKINRYALHIFP